MRRITALLLLSLLSGVLLAGCLDASQADRPAEASSRSASGGPANKGLSGGVPESTVGTSRIDGDLAGTDNHSLRVPFVEKTEDSGGSGYDADTVLAVRYGFHRGYERAVIDLGTGEEPAGNVPEWTLTSPEGDGLLRVDLPSASATCVSDSKLGEGLLENFHVVRAPEGGMFVDFFARKPFRYRAFGLQDPARLVVDFKPARDDLNVPPPAQGGDTVLVEPRTNSVISDPLTVSGYSRNFEAANAITLTGPHGQILVRRTVRSNDWSHTWGYFEATIDLPPFSGKGTLKVGTGNARDGIFEGVEIPVRAGR
jgi:Immunoglobulin-like domain of bacterial spore germination